MGKMLPHAPFPEGFRSYSLAGTYCVARPLTGSPPAIISSFNRPGQQRVVDLTLDIRRFQAHRRYLVQRRRLHRLVSQKNAFTRPALAPKGCSGPLYAPARYWSRQTRFQYSATIHPQAHRPAPQGLLGKYPTCSVPNPSGLPSQAAPRDAGSIVRVHFWSIDPALVGITGQALAPVPVPATGSQLKQSSTNRDPGSGGRLPQVNIGAAPPAGRLAAIVRCHCRQSEIAQRRSRLCCRKYGSRALAYAARQSPAPLQRDCPTATDEDPEAGCLARNCTPQQAAAAFNRHSGGTDRRPIGRRTSGAVRHGL